MPKLNRYLRSEMRNLVTNATVRRLTIAETQKLIKDKLHVDISEGYLAHVRMDLKRNCSKELRSLQLDMDHYLKCMFFDRVDECQYQQQVLHKIVDNNHHNPDVQIKATLALHGITINMHKLFQGFPVNMFYVPTTDRNGNGNGNNNTATEQSQLALEKYNKEKELDEAWKNDPTFAGMPGHNLDENYNPRPQPTSYVDPDFARDQP